MQNCKLKKAVCICTHRLGALAFAVAAPGPGGVELPAPVTVGEGDPVDDLAPADGDALQPLRRHREVAGAAAGAAPRPELHHRALPAEDRTRTNNRLSLIIDGCGGSKRTGRGRGIEGDHVVVVASSRRRRRGGSSGTERTEGGGE